MIGRKKNPREHSGNGTTNGPTQRSKTRIPSSIVGGKRFHHQRLRRGNGSSHAQTLQQTTEQQRNPAKCIGFRDRCAHCAHTRNCCDCQGTQQGKPSSFSIGQPSKVEGGYQLPHKESDGVKTGLIGWQVETSLRALNEEL